MSREADTLEQVLVEPELATYRRHSLEQFDVVLDYVESDGPIEAFEAGLLARDGYADAFRLDLPAARRQAIEAELLDRLRRLGDGIEPLVKRPETEFWPAVGAAFDRKEAPRPHRDDVSVHRSARTEPGRVRVRRRTRSRRDRRRPAGRWTPDGVGRVHRRGDPSDGACRTPDRSRDEGGSRQTVRQTVRRTPVTR
jgi:hypothetical protein